MLSSDSLSPLAGSGMEVASLLTGLEDAEYGRNCPLLGEEGGGECAVR